MRNIKLMIEYDGTDFVGWQIQAYGRTVQEEIEKALGQILQEKVSVIGAGRTDAGVHARGQVANFRTQSILGLNAIQGGLQGLLPRDIAVHAADEVDDNFHARYSARERIYGYHISKHPTALNRRFCWFVKYELVIDFMRQCADGIIGTHDFASFCAAKSDVKHHTCTVNFARWIERDAMLVFEIGANRFLHGMVRALVGTMVDVGRGYLTLDDFTKILEAKDRSAAGMSAPPQGLFLEEIIYSS